ncbi:hypothetical protein LHFGNBLO_000097 [Mesorhizobium sp. AR10]|uniref:hypothetical protein n=1 Tax=Mesorhizobium sp. AR10 TaxID=2865839 RepID=UPI002160301A|nr:hypothetical protein [Mesorhizobium sp. AR10]UVK38809.1 hypothetical protein LHFGNBLO_000097 [Mesorhizobium sp. AR10]
METLDPTDLSSLLERLTHTRRLLEHQLWEAARILSIDKSSPTGRRFAGLVEAGATFDPAMLLVAMSKPGRSVSSLSNTGRCWTCTVQPAAGLTGAATKRFTTDHADLPAAVLASLISSLLNAEESPWTKGLSKPAKGTCTHHDT